MHGTLGSLVLLGQVPLSTPEWNANASPNCCGLQQPEHGLCSLWSTEGWPKHRVSVTGGRGQTPSDLLRSLGGSALSAHFPWGVRTEIAQQKDHAGLPKASPPTSSALSGRHSGGCRAGGGSGGRLGPRGPRPPPGPPLWNKLRDLGGARGPSHVLTWGPTFRSGSHGRREPTAVVGRGKAAGDRGPHGAGGSCTGCARAAAEPRAPRSWGGAGGGAGRVTRGAGQWGARPGPSLLRAFAAPAASREPRGVSAELAAAGQCSAAATRGPAGEQTKAGPAAGPAAAAGPGARPPPPAQPPGPQDRRGLAASRACAKFRWEKLGEAGRPRGRGSGRPGGWLGHAWGSGGADWPLVVCPGAPAAVPSPARVSEEMSEERVEPLCWPGNRTNPWESDPSCP